MLMTPTVELYIITDHDSRWLSSRHVVAFALDIASGMTATYSFMPACHPNQPPNYITCEDADNFHAWARLETLPYTDLALEDTYLYVAHGEPPTTTPNATR